MSRVFVGMSGGVDSSVAAALLQAEGHDVLGVTMRLVADATPAHIESARAVCERLGIEHRVWDFEDRFERDVVAPFADAYAAGATPNPCVVCNARIKFGAFLDRARAEGARLVATGHYARVVDAEGGLWLARALDAAKDQSYFLYAIGARSLAHVSFPLGGLTKAAVRRYASELGLPAATRPESQEACFAPPEGHTGVVAARRPGALEPGKIVTIDGRVVGSHQGIARYTVGQRKGLGIASAGPMYVLRIDAAENRVVVGPADALEVTRIEAVDSVSYGPQPVAPGTDVAVMTRYRMRPVAGTLHSVGARLEVRLASPVRGVAPGQAVVCYVDERVVAGGTIACAG